MLPAVTNMAATAATFKFKDEESDVKFLSYFNLVLGLTTIFVELVFLDSFFWYRDNIGLWSGIFFILTGILSLHLLKDDSSYNKNKYCKLITKLSIALALVFGFLQTGLKFATIKRFRALQNGNAAQNFDAEGWCYVVVGVASFLCLNMLYSTQFKGFKLAALLATQLIFAYTFFLMGFKGFSEGFISSALAASVLSMMALPVNGILFYEICNF